MGATRRMDHYEASLGWQSLFIVSGVGVIVIGIGIAFQLLQIFVSFMKRHENRDSTGDAWNGRTLEWSIPSPMPEYNFARLPVVTERDAFWVAKQGGPKLYSGDYEDIEMPKNTGLPIIIAGWSFLFGFALIWHIYWLTAIGLIGLIVTILIRLSDDHTEYVIPAATVRKLDRAQIRSAA